MQTEGTYTAEVRILMEYVESKESLLIQIVRTPQHHTNSILHQTVKNLKKYFQSETKQVQKQNSSEHKIKMGRTISTGTVLLMVNVWRH
jgi:hypothetical protein